MRKIFYLFALTSIILSCRDIAAEPFFENNYYFENPQPMNDSELSKIPNKFQGIFMNSDSIFLNFNDKMILEERLYRFKIEKGKLDSLKEDFKLINGKFISKISKEIYDYRMLKDSVELSSKTIDTFFIFSNSQKAKRINGHLILNQKDSIFWRIKMINLEKHILKIRYISSDTDLKRIDSISKIKSKKIDSSSYIMNPSRREFKKIVDLKDLEYIQEFKKVSK